MHINNTNLRIISSFEKRCVQFLLTWIHYIMQLVLNILIIQQALLISVFNTQRLLRIVILFVLKELLDNLVYETIVMQEIHSLNDCNFINHLYNTHKRLAINSKIEYNQSSTFISLCQFLYYNNCRSTMVKICTITHDPSSTVTRTPNAEHPFSRAREFQRAYNATKLNKIFAKPFLGTLTGHSDGISVLSKCPLALNKMISGAHDGQIRVWDIAQRSSLISLYDHNQTIKGVSFSKDGSRFLSSSADKSINLYDFKTMFDAQDNDQHVYGDFKINKKKRIVQPLTKYLSKLIIGNVDHSPQENQFATAGQLVQVWSYERTKPIYQLQWNIDTILKVKYNPSDSNILCASCIDRSIILYDLRGETPVQKITLPNKSMCLSFNPIEPINFTVGNDDSNCYSFDMRKMDKAKTIHKDHIGAIIDLDYAPTGRQFVTGSFDKTIRIFNYDSGRSKQVYHAKRMQIVSSVQYTVDAQYILSGSEDMNIRLWKSIAWRPTGTVNTRQERAIEYREKLINKYIHSNKIRRIANYRHLPKYILNANKRRQDQTVSRHNKRLNKQANTGIKEDKKVDKLLTVQNIQIPEEKVQYKRSRKEKKPKQNEQRHEDEQGLIYE